MGISFDFRSEDYGELQHLVDACLRPASRATPPSPSWTCSCVPRPSTSAQTSPRSLTCCPPATFTRTQLCDQMNSILSGHGWGGVYGTVE